MTPLQHYPYLQHIDLSHNCLESLSVLSPCLSLRSLDASHNLLSSLLDFSSPRALEEVNYSHNNLGQLGPTLITNKYMRKLDISVNRIEELDGIGHLTRLTWLDVSRNQLVDLAAVSCSSLDTLDASGNFLKDCSSLQSSMSELRTLRLDDNQITSLAGVDSLHLLRTLSLASNQVGALDEVARLASLEHLVELDLRGNSLTEEDGYRVRLLHLLPNLEVLDGVPVEASEIVAAHNAHGADAGMREAISRLYLPKEDATLPRDGVRTVSALSSGPTGAASPVGQTVLPESEFWSLLTERGLIGEWKEWLRLAKKRVPDATTFYDDDDPTPGACIDLGGVHLGEAGCWALSELLSVRTGEAIASLDLAHAFHPSRWSARLSDAYGARLLFASFGGLTHLRTLRLSHCHLGREGGVLLASYLATPTARALRSLHLAHNQLGANLTATSTDGQLHVVDSCPGLRAVLGALVSSEVPAELEYLDLANNLIDAQGARVVADYLAVTSTAVPNARVEAGQVQPAGEASFDDDEEAPLSPLAPTAPTPLALQTLVLDCNPLSDAGVSLIAMALRTNDSLTSLSLRGDADRSVGPRGLVDLALGVSRYNRRLARIDLSSNRRLFGGEDASSSLQSDAAVALATTLFHATNGPNEAGELRELILADTGVTDAVVMILAGALSRNNSLRALDLAANPLIGEAGQDALFAALRTHALEELRVGPMTLGQKSALRAAEWLRTSETVRIFTTTPSITQYADADASAWGLTSDAPEVPSALQSESAPGDLSELVLSTLSTSLNVSRTRSLHHLGLHNLGPHLSAVLATLTVPLTESAPSSEDGLPVLVEHGLLTSIDLSGNTWDLRSFELLIAVVARQTRCDTLVLRRSTLSEEVRAHSESLFARLVGGIIAAGAITKLDLSGTQLSVDAIEGIGSGLLGEDGLAVNATLTSIDLSECGIDGFAELDDGSQGESSKFLHSLAADCNSLSTLSLRGNDLAASDLSRLVSSLDANWSLRELDLSRNTIRGNEEGLVTLREMIAHAVSHGLHRLAVPHVKHQVGATSTRDAIIGAVARGWSTGVARATRFISEQDRTPESVLHTLAIDLGDAFDAITWQQKQSLLESIRPLRQTETTQAQESFRLVRLTAAGQPIRVQTQPATCGVDLIETALAARLACQRL